MIYVQKVSALYKGKDIASHPIRYPWWRRLLAFLLRDELPTEILVDVATVTFTVQGPDHEFLEKEGHYRVQSALQKYQRRCEDAYLVNITYGAVFEHHGTRPIRDYSPNKSRDYDAWAATFAD